MRRCFFLSSFAISAFIVSGCASSVTVYARFAKGASPSVAVLDHDPAADGTALLDGGRLALDLTKSDGAVKRVYTQVGTDPKVPSGSFIANDVNSIIADADAPGCRYEVVEIPVDKIAGEHTVWLLILMKFATPPIVAWPLSAIPWQSPIWPAGGIAPVTVGNPPADERDGHAAVGFARFLRSRPPWVLTALTDRDE